MQLALVYDAAIVGAEDWSEELAWFARAVDVLGHKEVAYKLDIAPSNLTDAIKERERKDVKGRWISIVRRMVNTAAPEQIDAYMRTLSRNLGFRDPERERPKTAEERERERDVWLAKNAPALLVAMNKELGR